MNIPNFEDTQVVDKDGKFTSGWKTIMQQLFQELQNNVNQEGFKIPQQTSANIATLSTAQSVGTIIYNSDTNKFYACIPSGAVGIFKEINLI